MISTNELKNGFVIDVDGVLSTVVEFQHVKPGKGGAFVRTKLKNLSTGAVVDKTFRAGEKLPRVTTMTRNMQYLYEDGADLVLMDNETYEQIHFPGEGVENRDLLAPNAEVSMFPWKEPKERIPLAIRQIRSFLRAHRPVSA